MYVKTRKIIVFCLLYFFGFEIERSKDSESKDIRKCAHLIKILCLHFGSVSVIPNYLNYSYIERNS